MIVGQKFFLVTTYPSDYQTEMKSITIYDLIKIKKLFLP